MDIHTYGAFFLLFARIISTILKHTLMTTIDWHTQQQQQNKHTQQHAQQAVG